MRRPFCICILGLRSLKARNFSYRARQEAFEDRSVHKVHENRRKPLNEAGKKKGRFLEVHTAHAAHSAAHATA